MNLNDRNSNDVEIKTIIISAFFSYVQQVKEDLVMLSERERRLQRDIGGMTLMTALLTYSSF